MAYAAPRIRERLARDGDEFPVVARGVQRQLQDAISLVVLHLGVRQGRAQGEGARTAHARDEFADTGDRIGHTGRGLRPEALIVVIVAGEHELRAGVVQRLPQRLRRGVGQGAGAEERVMHIGERATLRARGEIGAQPLFLRRARGLRDVAVEGDDVPVAQVVAVVALRGIARRRAEIAEVPRRAGRAVLVVAGDRPGARLVPAPRGVVAVGVIGARPAGIGVVARQEHGAGDRVEQVCGEGVAVAGAVCDVAGAD